MTFRLPAFATLVLLTAGCAQTVDSSAVATTASPTGHGNAVGNATLVVFWPCMDTTIKFPDWMKGHPNIKVDGQAFGTITVCEHRKLGVSSGRHAVRIADSFVDIGSLAGNGRTFHFDAGKTVYLKLILHRSGVAELVEVDGDRGNAEVNAINQSAR